jgi:hypothetical protein
MNGVQEKSQGSAGGQGGPRAAGAQKGADRGRTARVYLPPAKAGGTLNAVEFIPGLTDGQYVEVRKGDLAEGEKIVVGLATSQGQDVGGLAGMARGPRR